MQILRRASVASLLLLTIALAVARSDAADQGRNSGELPDGPGVNLVYAKCQECHPINYVTDSAGLPDFLWQDTLSLMKRLGMQVTEQEEETLYQYLTTYLGTDPPPEPGADADAGAGAVNGAAVYAETCASCHGSGGEGTPGAFPPLAGHAPDLAAADRSYLPLVVVYGVAGSIEARGDAYDGFMPGWGHLSNGEIAAVINLVASGWGSDEASGAERSPYTADEIEAVRGLGLSGADVRERRPEVP